MKYIFIILFLTSCGTMKKNQEYANDFNSMDKSSFAKKYYTLYQSQIIDFSKIKKEKPYKIFGRNNTFQIVVFNDDGYIYESQLMPMSMLQDVIPSQKLTRGSFFSVEDETLKIEKMAASPGNVYSVIEEGTIKGDTIFMKKRYNTKGAKNKRNLFSEYTLVEEIKLHKLGDDFFIESK